MSQIDWLTLRSFVTVAEEGHITRAAERLDTQQPPLSLRIRALERRLDTQLFRRKPRGVELTAAGHVLLGHARTLLEQHARALDAVQRAGRGELGRLSIGTVPTGPMHPLMPSSVRLFRERYPDVVPDWHFDNRPVERVGEGIDAAVGGGFTLAPGLVARKRAPVHIVATRAHCAPHPVRFFRTPA